MSGRRANANTELVADATIDLGFWKSMRMRRSLLFRSWRAVKKGAGTVRGMAKKTYQKGFDEYFAENAPDFGEYFVKSGMPQALCGPLDRVGNGTSPEPYLVIRKVFPSRWLPWRVSGRFEQDPDDPSQRRPSKDTAHYIRKGRYDMIASGLIRAAGADLRKKLSNYHTAYRDYVTAIDAEKSQFEDGGDLHLRFRQATPELPFGDQGGTNAAARILVFACVENSIRDPIGLLRVEDVVAALPPATREQLQKPHFRFFDNWINDRLERERELTKPVLCHPKGEPNWWLSFDANRFDPSFDKTDQTDLRAVAELMRTIKMVAAKKERLIVLNRGDALVVDNYRTLVRRHEQGHAYWDFFPLGRPAQRWLRVYYGFPRVLDHHAGGHGGTLHGHGPAHSANGHGRIGHG